MQVIGWVPVDDPVRARAAAREQRALRWRRRSRRLRRPAAALALAAAAALVVLVLRPPPPATTSVLAAATTLPAGHRLDHGDLVPVDLPRGAVPAVAVPAGGEPALVGRTLASPVAAGELVTSTRTAGSGLLDDAPPGTLAVPVAVSTALPEGSLTAGDAFAVLAGGGADPYAELDGSTGGPGGDLLVASAAVLVAPVADDQGSGLLGDPAAGGVALLALTTAQAEAVVGAAGTRPLTLALLPRAAAPPS